MSTRDDDEITTVNNIYNNTIHTSGGNTGNMVLLAFTILQMIIFVINSTMSLRLPTEQLWFPIIAFIGIFCVGLYCQCK